MKKYIAPEFLVKNLRQKEELVLLDLSLPDDAIDVDVNFDNISNED